MNPGIKIILKTCLFVAASFVFGDVVSAQNDWGKPVRKQLPPNYWRRPNIPQPRTSQQPRTAAQTRPTPRANQHRRAVSSPQSNAPIQNRTGNRTSPNRHAYATETPSAANLFGVRLAQGVEMEFDGLEEVEAEEIDAGIVSDGASDGASEVPIEEIGGEEYVAQEAGDPNFNDDDIYYEDESLDVADGSLGSAIVHEDFMTNDEDYAIGCADCMEGCSSCGRSTRRCIKCRGGGMFVSGNGSYFVQPMWQTNPAFSRGNAATLAATTLQTETEFDWDYHVSPYGWIGFKGASGLGLRGRFWAFDNDATVNLSVPAGQNIVSAQPNGLNLFAGPGSQISARHEMEFYATDIEFSFEKQNEQWGIESAAGVRYLDLDQYYSLTSTAAGGARNQVTSKHNFDGIGPTVFVKANHGLGIFGLNVFASGRESILFGDRNTTVTSNVTRTGKGQAVVSITELELGLQRVVWLRRMGIDFQLAFVGQFWGGVGNAANGGMFATQRDQGMGLFGGRATMGVSF